MDAELKAKWIAALRSGKYRQGREQLRLADEFCCLGVLADVAGCTWGPVANIMRPVLDGVTNGSPCFLGQNFLSRTGLTDQQQLDLARLNDHDSSFAEIADVIEAEL